MDERPRRAPASIESQSVKTSEAGGPRGDDAGKKIMGRKWHALVDTDGRGLVLFTRPASVQDREGVGPLLPASRLPFPHREGLRRWRLSGTLCRDRDPHAVEIVRGQSRTRSASPSNHGDGWSSASSLDQPRPSSLERCRRHNRIRDNVPLCRGRHVLIRRIARAP
jgi:hypothetical protein